MKKWGKVFVLTGSIVAMLITGTGCSKKNTGIKNPVDEEGNMTGSKSFSVLKGKGDDAGGGNGRSFSLFVIFGFYVQYFCYLIYGIFRSRSGWNFRHPLSGSFI